VLCFFRITTRYLKRYFNEVLKQTLVKILYPWNLHIVESKILAQWEVYSFLYSFWKCHEWWHDTQAPTSAYSAQWITWLLSQWMLHWWWVNANNMCEPFPCTHTTQSKRLDRQVPFSSFRCDLTGNRTQPSRFGGTCSDSYTSYHVFLVIKLLFQFKA